MIMKPSDEVSTHRRKCVIMRTPSVHEGGRTLEVEEIKVSISDENDALLLQPRYTTKKDVSAVYQRQGPSQPLYRPGTSQRVFVLFAGFSNLFLTRP